MKIDNIFNKIKLYSYIITLKVKSTGVNNILSSTITNKNTHIYPCPSNIYLNNKLFQNYTDCHFIDIKESDTEIKLEWDNIVNNSLSGIFYNCINIIEVDMTNFDTSLITDMSEMFSMCHSLKSLNVQNLNTAKVESFRYMFFECISLISINLESFTIPKATTLYRMFFNCQKLEYINIKNFEEKENTDITEMFYNIPKNAVICLLSCPPPTNFTISSMNDTQATVSWEGYDLNNFIISYGPQSLENPENGNIINVNNKNYYIFTDLNPNQKYNIYIKTQCGNKSSYWIGPLLISIDSYNMSHTGTNSITTCSKVIYDSGGPNDYYKDYADSTLIIKPEISGKFVSVKGNINLERNYDYLYIYNGEGTNGILLGKYTDWNIIPLTVSTTGPLTIRFYSDYSIIRSGFELVVDCIINTQTIYYQIINNNCRMISCEENWRNIQNLIVSYTGICVKNCKATSYKYLFKGKCYDNCPENTTNSNFICYSNSLLEKCENYSIESDFENLCIKCKDNYYPILNDKNNKYGFIDCYEKNSLEKYYLDNDDLVFKYCYKSCKTCNQNGTNENHNCLTCDSNYEFNITSGEYYNCYQKCNNYYYFDKDKNYICLTKNDCLNNNKNVIEEKNQCIDECYNDTKYKYQFRKKCYQDCPTDITYISETKNNFCEVKCDKQMPLEKIENQDCTNFCGINEMNNKLCISKYQDKDTNGNLILQNIIQDISSSNFDINILSNNNIIINESFITFIITNYHIQETTLNNIINLGNCENILKNNYNIENNEDLIIFIIDIDNKEEQINKLVYEVYSKTEQNILQKLDLNLCKDVIVNNNNILNNNIIIQCSTYSIDSIIDNSCITCREPYYPKYEDILENKTFIKCYHNIDGYYLYKDNYFKKCYESCALCEKEGNINNHNCIKCKKEYVYELNISSYLNCYKKCDFNYYYDEKNDKYYCTPDNNCVNYFDKIIPEENKCVYDCKQESLFPFEFQKRCYNSCPINISEISKEKNNYCEIKCPKDSPYEIIATQQCVKNCTFSQIANKLCKLNFKSDNKNEENEAQEQLVENVKEEITNNIDVSEIEKEDITIEEKDITITIAKNDNQKNEISRKTNTTSIDLGECEKRIKNKYNISDNASLYILKMDVKQDGYKIPKIQYEVYYPLNEESKLSQLNLSLCEDININIYLPLKIDGSLALYDPNSEFYNDICTTFEENGKDLTLSARKKYFINHKLTLCEENCELVSYNKTIEKANCSCKTKTDFVSKISDNNLEEEGLYEMFTDFDNILNLKILNCINSIFTVKAFKENYANIILISIIALYFICLILFVIKGYNNEIEFYIDIIIYFTLFSTKIKYIIQKKKKEEMKKNTEIIEDNIKNTVNSIKNNNNNINNNNKTKEIKKKKIFDKIKNLKTQNILIIKPPIFNIMINTRNNSTIKNEVSNPNKKKERPLNLIKRRNLEKRIHDKIKAEEKSNIKLIKNNNIFNSFKNLSEKQIYDLHIKLNTKTDKELNNLPYKDALKYDKRTYFSFYFSLLRCNHLLFFSFFPKFDFNSRIIKIYLFFFNFATYFFVNALFFTDETISDGFDFVHNLPQIIYSSIISAVINEIIKLLTLTEISFIKYRNFAKKEKILMMASELKRDFKIKFVIFYILDLILLGCFWIYLSCFSAVYQNTQLHLIKDTFISFGTTFISPMAIYLLPGIFRINSLKNRNRRILYQINQILQLI